MASKAIDEEYKDGESRIAEVKVSSDGGETWFRREINFGAELDESGLVPGEIFQFQEDKYQVIKTEDGMTAQKIKPPARKRR